MKSRNIILILLLFAILLKVGTFAFINVVSYIEDNKKIQLLQKELKELNNENDWLTYKIKYASSNAFIEKYAREKLMLAKKGETVVYFDFDDNTETKASAEKQSENFFKKMLDKLLHLFQK